MTLQPDLFRRDFLDKLHSQELKLKFGPVYYNDLNENTLYLALYTDLPGSVIVYDIVYVKLVYDMNDRVSNAWFYSAGDDSEVCEPNAIALLLSAEDKERFTKILRGTPL